MRLIERPQSLTGTASAKTPRLLLIDDDPGFHTLLEDELTLLGYQIDSALEGARGIEMAEQVRPDAIILDLMMPGMSGFEVAEVLKERATTARIPILVLTSKDLTAEDRDLLQSKIAALVPKGTSAKTRLIAAIQQLERRT
ncbi:MAG TPA: response regulator [Thermoanaerobaculia bacterium]